MLKPKMVARVSTTTFIKRPLYNPWAEESGLAIPAVSSGPKECAGDGEVSYESLGYPGQQKIAYFFVGECSAIVGASSVWGAIQ